MREGFGQVTKTQVGLLPVWLDKVLP
jgi:hypothetical protein